MESTETEVVNSLKEKLTRLRVQLDEVLKSVDVLKKEERVIRLQMSTIEQTIGIYTGATGEEGQAEATRTSASYSTSRPQMNASALGSKKNFFEAAVIHTLESDGRLLNKKEIENKIIEEHGEARVKMLSQYIKQLKGQGLLCSVRLNNSHKRLFYGLADWNEDETRLQALITRFQTEQKMEVESYEWI